jgi:two-component system torCAD operon response regulator TorR
LVGADGRPLSRDYLAEVISNRQSDVDSRTVDALVARLRRKLAEASAESRDAMIVTVSGVGYRLGIAAERDP